MERIEAQSKDQVAAAKRVISWIACAKRPLTTTELQLALAVEANTYELDEQNLAQIDDLVSVCAGLVTVDQESNTVRLLHYTTQRYFEQRQSQWLLSAEADITTVCITYLSFKCFGGGACHTDGEFETRLQSNQFYDYASHNWGHHARKADKPIPNLVEFLKGGYGMKGAAQALLSVKLDANYSQKYPTQVAGVHLAAYFGIEGVMKNLLSEEDPDSKDNWARTPLSYAAENGHEDIIQLLLNKGAEFESKDNNGRTPLSYAAQEGHGATVERLLDNGAKIDSKDTYGSTPLSWAIAFRQKVVVKLLLDKGADHESKDNFGRTPLSWAAEDGYEDAIQLLLKKGADLESKGNNGRTPLSYAAQGGKAAVIKLLLSKGADPKLEDNDGQSPLSRASCEGAIELLLNKGAELESKDNDGRTPLSWASEGCD
ncbi:hypothetical protein ACKAV7_006927 [Fusarium commune]